MAITVGGTSITFSDATTQTTAGLTTAVTSAVAGNGITVSGATGAVTISQDFYTGTSSTNTSFPVGSYIFIYANGGLSGNRNSTVVVKYDSTFPGLYTISGGGTTISGTWRQRGGVTANCCTPTNTFGALVQRTA